MRKRTHCTYCLCRLVRHTFEGCKDCRCTIPRNEAIDYVLTARSCVQCSKMKLCILMEPAELMILDHRIPETHGKLTTVPAGETVAFCGEGYWEGMTWIKAKTKESSSGKSTIYIDNGTHCLDYEQGESRMKLAPLSKTRIERNVEDMEEEGR